MTVHCSILVCRIPWSGEPEGLQSIGLQRIGHDGTDWAHPHTRCLTFWLLKDEHVAGGDFSRCLWSRISNHPHSRGRGGVGFKLWGCPGLPLCSAASLLTSTPIPTRNILLLQVHRWQLVKAFFSPVMEVAFFFFLICECFLYTMPNIQEIEKYKEGKKNCSQSQPQTNPWWYYLGVCPSRPFSPQGDRGHVAPCGAALPVFPTHTCAHIAHASSRDEPGSPEDGL